METIAEIIVPEGMNKCRADKVLADHFHDLSRTRIQDAFKLGNVKLNGAVIQKRVIVSAGDKLIILLPEKKEISVSAVKIPLQILFEDEDIVVIDKLSGMVTHPGSGTGDDTIVHALLHHCDGNLSSAGGSLRPGVVHRLDKETSGVMMFAKSDAAYCRLVEMFANREVKKEYLALVQGHPKIQAGSVKTSILRHPRYRTKMQVHPKGKVAHTDWAVIESWKSHAALLCCQIHTGRTHQIRVHLSSINHPLIGDKTYGYRPDATLPSAERIYLHAVRLEITHPVSGEELAFEAPLPPDYESYLNELRKRYSDR
jgi:23S rRNA pseudouridine1911/1915/1917 synthase